MVGYTRDHEPPQPSRLHFGVQPIVLYGNSIPLEGIFVPSFYSPISKV